MSQDFLSLSVRSYEVRISCQLAQRFFTDGDKTRGNSIRFEGCPPAGFVLIKASLDEDSHDLRLVFQEPGLCVCSGCVDGLRPELLCPIVHEEPHVAAAI